MGDFLAVTSDSFQVGPKGRVVLPAAVRHAAGVESGTTLVARTDARGRIVLESPDALRERVWAAAPAPSGLDVTADVRALRIEDAARGDRAAAERAQAASGDDVGAALLEHLGR